MKQEVQSILLTTLTLLVIMVIVMIKLLEKIIINPLDKFQKGLNTFFRSLGDETTEVEKLDNNNKDEIGVMSQKTNEAIKTAVKTHAELIDLRKQLELKVELTTQNLYNSQREIDLANQIKNESLEYGAIIQKSILPNPKKLNNIFSDSFILNEQKGIINSKFCIFEEIKRNEYIFTIIDSKKDGINSVFVTMLANAIIKQYITKLKYENNDEVCTSSIIEYLNNNIESSKDGFDCAVIYYNKNKNIIKYSSANISLQYFQDNSMFTIQSDNKAIGIEKNTKYTGHTIDTKEYLEFYLSTQNYIDNCLEVCDFKSPFQTKNNIFSKKISSLKDDILIVGFKIDNKPKIIIEYDGEFTQQILNKYMETIEEKIENVGLLSNISTNFIEQYQNILNYGKSKDITNDEITPLGSITMQINPDNSYSIITSNILTQADKEKIEPKIIEIQSLDKKGIRSRYRELRKSGQNTHKKGGGIGFYEIAKRCTKIEYTFTQINSDRFEFTFISSINFNKLNF